MSSPSPFFRQGLVPICRALAAAAAILALAVLPAGASARTCKKLTVGQKSSGHTVTLHHCDRLTIRLTQQFDGGYQWKIVRRPSAKVLKLVSNKTVAPPVTGLVGGTDTRVIVYRAVGKGQTSLKLVESRSFQRNSQIAKFTLVVHVR
jgi:predicted secreted protein